MCVLLCLCFKDGDSQHDVRIIPNTDSTSTSTSSGSKRGDETSMFIWIYIYFHNTTHYIGNTRSIKPRSTWEYKQYPQYRTSKYCEYSQYKIPPVFLVYYYQVLNARHVVPGTYLVLLILLVPTTASLVACSMCVNCHKSGRLGEALIATPPFQIATHFFPKMQHHYSCVWLVEAGLAPADTPTYITWNDLTYHTASSPPKAYRRVRVRSVAPVV